MQTLVVDGTVVTAVDAYRADVLVEDGVIRLIGRSLPRDQAALVINAAGQYVLPGGVDVHTHLEMPFGGTVTADDFTSGTTAAACGGTTTIVDFAVQSTGDSLRGALEVWLRKAEGKAVIDYSFHVIIRDPSEQAVIDIEGLVRDGVPSFKLFMAYPRDLQLDDGAIFHILRRVGSKGGLVCVHAENGSVIDVLVREALRRGDTAPKFHALTRPTTTETEATRRAIALAEIADSPVYFVHVSCRGALAAVQDARSRGRPVFAETCPHYLTLTAERYDAPGFEGAKFVMTPPLREPPDQQALWDGLARNHLQVVSSDHCVFRFDGQKDLGRSDFSRIPNGVPGIETRIAAVHDGAVRRGAFNISRLVEVVATNPAKLMGLFPRKGTIAVGSDGDIVIFDPTRTARISAATHHSRVDYSLYEGMELAGVPVTVLVRGVPVVQDQRFVGRAGHGEFVRRGTPQFV